MGYTNFPKYPGETRLVHNRSLQSVEPYPSSNSFHRDGNVMMEMRRKLLLTKTGNPDPHACVCCRCMESFLKNLGNGPTHHCFCSLCQTQQQQQQQQYPALGQQNQQTPPPVPQTPQSLPPPPTQKKVYTIIKSDESNITSSQSVLVNKFQGTLGESGVEYVYGTIRLGKDAKEVYLIRLPKSELPQ